MEAFTNDFKELKALYGPLDEKDPFNWSQFKMNIDDDLDVFDAENAATAGKSSRVTSKQVPEEDTVKDFDVTDFAAEETDIDADGGVSGDNRKRRIKFTDIESGEEKLVPLEDHKILKDEEGHLWAGFIINNDTTQKITPGVRILSFRTLVVVGNGRGTAGFGKGKGLTADLSLASAFR